MSSWSKGNTDFFVAIFKHYKDQTTIHENVSPSKIILSCNPKITSARIRKLAKCDQYFMLFALITYSNIEIMKKILTKFDK